MIPTVGECLALMTRYRMLANIRLHSIMVARVAECLVQDLQRSGYVLSPELAVAGALLHDIAKTPCLASHGNHAREGREICLRHQFQEIADLVGEHILLSGPVQPAGISEKEIVFYADKRINHDRIVSLEERLAYILDRYGRDDEERRRAILKNFEQCRQVESKMYQSLAYPPAALVSRLARSDSLFPELQQIWVQEALARPC